MGKLAVMLVKPAKSVLAVSNPHVFFFFLPPSTLTQPDLVVCTKFYLNFEINFSASIKPTSHHFFMLVYVSM